MCIRQFLKQISFLDSGAGPYRRQSMAIPSIMVPIHTARENLFGAGCTPISMAPTEVIANKGHHSRCVLNELDGGVWKMRIAKPKANCLFNWTVTTRSNVSFTSTVPS